MKKSGNADTEWVRVGDPDGVAKNSDSDCVVVREGDPDISRVMLIFSGVKLSENVRGQTPGQK